MNWEQIRGSWDQAKGELKIRWGKLTDDDLTEIAGERDKLVGRLERLYGISKEEAQRQVDELTGDCGDLCQTMYQLASLLARLRRRADRGHSAAILRQALFSRRAEIVRDGVGYSLFRQSL